MKRFFTLAFAFSFVNLFPAIAQKVDLSYLTSLSPQFVANYKLPDSGALIVRMPFADSVLRNGREINALKGKPVYRIDLVYTDFQVSPSFKQPELNRGRLRALKKVAPWIFNMSIIDWNMVAQTSCRNEEAARKLFHGFVIYYGPSPTKESVASELMTLEKILSSDSLGHWDSVATVKLKFKSKRVPTDYFVPRSKTKMEEGIRYARKSIWNRKREFIIHRDTTLVETYITRFTPSDHISDYLDRHLDSTVMKALERNRQWDSILFVQDVTGSMSPYYLQLLVWNRLNFPKALSRDFIFFNDGDNKPDDKKVIGSTGGIYYVKAEKIEDVEETFSKASKAGGGGDCPENNIEALIESLKHSRDCKEIVMIADNWANVKDMSILSKVNHPVRIILCGVMNGFINTDYLDIARATGGSVHTMEEDLTDLMKVNEGQTITIRGNMYKLDHGKFRLVSKI